MKLVGIVGSNAEISYNRKLMEFIAREYKDLFTLELLDITNLPMFNQDEDHSTENKDLLVMNRKILQADGVIISTPEHNHTITASLKSALEWLSYELHPFENKPVMVVVHHIMIKDHHVPNYTYVKFWMLRELMQLYSQVMSSF